MALSGALGDLGFEIFQGFVFRSEHGDQSGVGPVKGIRGMLGKLVDY